MSYSINSSVSSKNEALQHEIKVSRWKTAGKVAVITTLALAAIAAAAVAGAATFGLFPAALAVALPTVVWITGGVTGFVGFGGAAALAGYLLFGSKEAQKLSDKLRDRSKELQNCKAELERAQKELNQQRQNLESLKQEKTLSNDSLSQATTQIDKKNDEIQRLKEKLEQFQGENENLQQQVKQQKKHILGLENQIKNLQAEVVRLRSENRNNENLLKQLGRDNDKIKSAGRENQKRFQGENQDLQQRVRQQKEHILDLENQIRKLRSENRNNENLLKQLGRDNDKIKSAGRENQKRFQGENQDLQKQVKQQKEHILDLENQIRKLRSENRNNENMQKQFEASLGRPLTAEEKNLFVHTKALFDEFSNKRLDQVDIAQILPSLNEAVGEARKMQSRQQFAALQGQLERILGKEDAAEWVKDPEIIGSDGADNIPLPESRIEEIVGQARKYMAAEAAIEKVKDELQKGFPAKNEFMEQMHPELKNLPDFGKRGKELDAHYRTLINQAFVTAEIRKKNNYLKGSQTEIQVLQAFGYDINGDYDKSEIVREAMIGLMSQFLRPPTLQKPNQEVRRMLGIQARYTRLTLAGVPEEKCAFVDAVIRQGAALRAELIKRIRPLGKELKYVSPEVLDQIRKVVPKNTAGLPLIKRSVLIQEGKKARGEFFESCKDLTLEKLEQKRQACVRAFEDRLPELEKQAEVKLEKTLVWLSLLDQDIKIVEYSQGENDPNEALGTGVCYAICYHMGANLIKNREMAIDQLNKKSISNKERYFQALYAAAFRANRREEDKPFLPEQYQKHEGVCIVPLITVQKLSSHDRTTQVETIMKKIESQGGRREYIINIQGGSWGHALFAFVDAENQRYIFSDPNFFTIEKRDVGKAEGVKWIEESLSQLIDANYDDTLTMGLERVEEYA